MGILDGLKSMGRGLASIPGKLNEARYSHKTIMVPVGKDPVTGEDIEVSEEELRESGMYDPATGQVVMPKQVRTGPSKFGNFLTQGLPRMLSGGMAAVAAGGDGSSGIVSAMRGMQIGGQHLQNQDLLMERLRRDRMAEQDLANVRASQAAENRAQAEMYKAKMNQPAPVREPTTWEAELVQMHRQALQAGDVEKANAVADKLTELRGKASNNGWMNLGGAAFNPETGEMRTPEKPVTPKPHVERGRFWRDVDKGEEEMVATIFDPNQNKEYTQVVEGSRRKKQVRPAARGPQRTPAQQDAALAQEAANKYMTAAGQNFDSALDLARKANAPIAVQNIIVDAKRKATPPNTRNPTRRTAPSLSGGGGSWKDAKAKVAGGR